MEFNLRAWETEQTLQHIAVVEWREWWTPNLLQNHLKVWHKKANLRKRVPGPITQKVRIFNNDDQTNRPDSLRQTYPLQLSYWTSGLFIDPMDYFLNVQLNERRTENHRPPDGSLRCSCRLPDTILIQNTFDSFSPPIDKLAKSQEHCREVDPLQKV